MMNFKCLICSDLFVSYSEISTTPCGHLFHYSCLLQWLDRSKSCPQCRSKSTEKTIHRIFLSVEEYSNSEPDVATLHNQIDNLNFQLKMKSTELEKSNKHLKVSKDQTLALRLEVKDLEDKIKMLDSAMHALKEQIKYFKSKSKESERLQEEAAILKNKIIELENVQLAISGSRDQVNDMLRYNRDPQSLTVLVSTLKKELIDSDKRKKQVQVMLKDAQSEVQSKVRELMVLSKQNTQLLHEVEVHKNCASERIYLKKRIDELRFASIRRTSSTHNNTTDRILLESPVPLPKVNHISPSVPEKVQAIQESDSPYLRVQSSSIGLSELMNYNHNVNIKRPSIFKQTLKIQTFPRPSTSVSYDGLGGHSKDEHIRTERSDSLNIKKRPRPSSSTRSVKLQKLAPQNKLDKYFDDPKQ